MSLIILNVDEIKRTLSASGGAFVTHDKEVDIVRFAINSGFADIVLDGQVALRVMYQRPGETEVRAQTLTYYDTDGLRNYYDWNLLPSDLTEKGTLTVALCILRTDGDVEEWHTTPCQIRVLDTIHTDDSDEGDESITPTVAQRVAVLETMIQRVASGAPIVVASTSAMTDTDQIYVLSTDGNWYYHNGSAWVAGGEYGAVATDTTLTQQGVPADAKATGDAIDDLNTHLDNILVTFETTYITFNTQGGIDAGTGRNNTAANRCRHTGYIAADVLTTGDKAYIYVTPGYKVGGREWDSTETATNTYIGMVDFLTGGDWATGIDSFTVTPGHAYRFIIGKMDDSNITPSSLPENVAGYYYKTSTDRTLTMGGKAADAKVVGDMLAEFDVAINTVQVTRWLNGGIMASTGTNKPWSNRCRSKGHITGKELAASGTAIITVASGYKVGVREWDEDMEYVGYPAFDGSGFATGEASFAVTPNHSYRFVIGKTDDSDITKANIPEGVLGYSSHARTDPSLTIYGKAADAGSVGDAITPYTAKSPVGNSTILAAKYFTFTDGTQPVIDWYLLCDINNNLYISKDLTLKRYIGNFPDADKYKFGIRQNGDIIAVFRNEFSETGESYSSALDNVRQNPFVLVAAENYARTEVDFEGNLSPTGWLGNCGFCSLPNGDIIFGEYTRMMVLWTSNLWKIAANADIADPASWQVLKSFRVAENDLATYDESVIEHFHTVQVDPYTGTVYFATGDKGKKSQIWYSKDNGQTWTQQSFIDPATQQTVTSNPKLFRLLNFNFTEDYVYWSSDDPEDHVVLRATRAANGNGFNAAVEILATIAAIPSSRPATYGTVIYPEYGLLVMMERCDAIASSMAFRAYDFVNNEVVTICTISTTGGVDKHVGFRTEYTEFDPPDGVIRIGFGSNSKYRNVNALCGNTDNTNWKYCVNNLWIRICKDYAGRIKARFGTYYI